MPKSVSEFSDTSETTAATPGFGTWDTVGASKAAWLEIQVTVATDGTTDGLVLIDVDESGGTTVDYSFEARVPSALGGASDTEYLKVFIPAGAQYQVRNAQDPSAANGINTARLVIT